MVYEVIAIEKALIDAVGNITASEKVLFGPVLVTAQGKQSACVIASQDDRAVAALDGCNPTRLNMLVREFKAS